MAKEFKGIFPYLVSPVNGDGSIREEPLRRLVDHLIDCGVHGLTALGSTGEFFYLNWKQKKEVVRIVMEQTAYRVPVIAGVAASSIKEGIIQAREYEKMGVDGILIALEVYFPLKQEGIYSYFSEVAKEVRCPVVMYNNPKFSGFEFSTETLKRLSEVPNIKYYKDASVNTGRLFELNNLVGDDLKIFSASSHVPLFVMLMGGAGWMAGPSCIIPRESVELYELCKEKKWEEALVLQKRLWEINGLFQKYGLAGCIKAGLNLQGFDVGDPISPNEPVGEEGIEEIRLALLKIGAL